MTQKDVVYSIKHPDHEFLEHFKKRIYLEALYVKKVYHEPLPYGGVIILSSISRKPNEKEYNLEFRILGEFDETTFTFQENVLNVLRLIHQFKVSNFKKQIEDLEEEI